MRPTVGAGASTGVSKAEIEKLNNQVKDLTNNNEILDKEREFYFTKLRLIEELIQKKSFDKHPMGDGILKVLYASEEEQIDLDNDGAIMITSPTGETVTHTVVMPEETIEPKEAVNGN